MRLNCIKLKLLYFPIYFQLCHQGYLETLNRVRSGVRSDVRSEPEFRPELLSILEGKINIKSYDKSSDVCLFVFHSSK